MEPVGAGENAFFETYVFECDGEDDVGNPDILDWVETYGKRYATSIEAEKGHRETCEMYAIDQSWSGI
jgi:hypothetical protein